MTATDGVQVTRAQLSLTVLAGPPPAAPVDVVATSLGDQVVVVWQPGAGSTADVTYGVWFTGMKTSGCARPSRPCVWCHPWHRVRRLPSRSAVLRRTVRVVGCGDLNGVTIAPVEPPAEDALPSVSTEGVVLSVTDPVTGDPVTSVSPGQSISVTASGFGRVRPRTSPSIRRRCFWAGRCGCGWQPDPDTHDSFGSRGGPAPSPSSGPHAAGCARVWRRGGLGPSGRPRGVGGQWCARRHGRVVAERDARRRGRPVPHRHRSSGYASARPPTPGLRRRPDVS